MHTDLLGTAATVASLHASGRLSIMCVSVRRPDRQAGDQQVKAGDAHVGVLADCELAATAGGEGGGEEGRIAHTSVVAHMCDPVSPQAHNV